jgi:hypothetical protein
MINVEELDITSEDICKAIMSHKDSSVSYWADVLVERVNDGRLPNNKYDLIRWLSGVAGGWIQM